jgi:hypothetical protein
MGMPNAEATNFAGATRSEAALVFFVVFAVYIFCAYPALSPRDGADLLKAALTLFPAHPPGYPLYALSGHLWSELFPLGNFAYRMNTLSGLWGAGACAVFYLWARYQIDRLSAIALALALAFGRALWKFSLLPEMYSAQAFFLAILLFLSVGSPETRNKRAALSGLMAGLGVVNHQSLLLSLPAFALLWMKKDQEKSGAATAFKTAIPFFFLGLGLNVFIAIKLKSIQVAWEAITRSQYGTFALFSGLARPLDFQLILKLASYFAKNIVFENSPALFFLALWGFFRFLKTPQKRGEQFALLTGLLLSGPLFLLMTRFDPSNAIAKSVLEPAWIAPIFFLCALAVIGLSATSKKLRKLLALASCLWAFWLHAPLASHREDFAAQDYIDDLLRLIPPGSAALARGDTAVFGLKYSVALHPSAPPRELYSDMDENPSSWILSRMAEKQALILGMAFPELSSLGIYPGPHRLSPRALVQSLSSVRDAMEDEKKYWDITVLRPSPQLDNGDSYDYDIRRSFALAHYLSSGLDEMENPRMSQWNAEWATAIDPEDYRLSK